MTYTLTDIIPDWSYFIVNSTVSKSKGELNNVITNVNFYLTGICNLDNIEKRETQFISLNLQEPNPENFIDINEITQDTIISWISNHPITDAMKDVLKNKLLIEYNKNEYTLII